MNKEEFYSMSQQDVTDADMKFQEKDEQGVMIQADALEVLVFLLPLLRKWTLNSKLVSDRLQEQA